MILTELQDEQTAIIRQKIVRVLINRSLTFEEIKLRLYNYDPVSVGGALSELRYDGLVQRKKKNQVVTFSLYLKLVK